MTDYLNLLDLKVYLGLDPADTTDDARLNSLIAVASRAVEVYCRRRFMPYQAVRRFDFQESAPSPTSNKDARGAWLVNGALRELWLDEDLISITTLTNGNGTPFPPDSYILYPLRGPVYRKISLRRDIGQLFVWSRTPQASITIDGMWGYQTRDSEVLVPMAIKMWCAEMLREAQNTGVQSTSIGGYSVSFAQQRAPISHGTAGIQQLLPPLHVAQILDGIKFRQFTAAAASW